MQNEKSPQSILAIDIGGTNLKICSRDPCSKQTCFSMGFNMSCQVDELSLVLKQIIDQMTYRPDIWLITMTGELCDCFINRKQGVERILDSVATVAEQAAIYVWSIADGFISVDQAFENIDQVASANWHAQATWVAKKYSDQNLLLIDTGSTTTDLIPILQGTVATTGHTDASRLEHGELFYLGGSATPLMVLGGSIDGFNIMNEWFSNIRDAAVVLGLIPENKSFFDTSDRHSLTLEACARRVCRMVGHDYLRTFDLDQTQNLAAEFVKAARLELADLIQNQLKKYEEIDQLIVSGSGIWLLELVLKQHFPKMQYLCFDQVPQRSTAACAVAMMKLFEWRTGGKKNEPT